MSPRDIPRSSGLEWAGGRAELNLDVLEAQGGLPTDERALGWRILDMLGANAITLVLVVGCVVLVSLWR